MTKRPEISVIASTDPANADRAFEIVERKGIGHPDSICDGIVESVCQLLCHEYRQRFGRILHHNIDKGFLVAGRSRPRLGGGEIIEPMRFVFGDRGVDTYQGITIPVGDIARQAAADWLREHLRFVDPERHLIFQNEIKPGSAELVGNLLRADIGANDTSVGVGYAPLSPTEQTVLSVENWLNTPAFKQRFPASGEDIKVMGVRRGRALQLIVAMAFVDAHVASVADYVATRETIRTEIDSFVRKRAAQFDSIDVALNTLDDPAAGETGLYLTVLGTSAEGGDSGEVGRGNRVNGIIAYNRPTTTEAAAGKNPINHTGKIYNILSHRMAARIHATVPGISEVTVWLCSSIGTPVRQPLLAAAEVKLQPGCRLDDISRGVSDCIAAELAQLDTFLDQLSHGLYPVC